MNLINVSDEIMINPEMITTVELRGSGENKRVIVRVSNKDIVVSDPKQFIKDLQSHGITSSGQFTRL